MMQFADRLNDENHYASDKITEKARSIDERQGNNFSVVLFHKKFLSWAVLTSGLAWLPGSILPWVHTRNFTPVSKMRKRRRFWGWVQARNSRNEANMAKHKVLIFAPITAVKWDAYDVENSAGNARRCYPGRSYSFHPGEGWRVYLSNFSARLEKPRSREPSQLALSYEHIENFTKDLEVRRDLGNRAHLKRPLKQNKI